MTLKRGRVLRASDNPRATPLPVSRVAARVLKSVVADAAVEAGERVRRAEQRAAEILAMAERDARAIRERAHAEGRQAGESELATAWLQMKSEEARTDERTISRTIDIARAMAERLLGEALTQEPTLIVAIARQALTSARNARRVAIRAHSTDAAVLHAQLPELGLEGAVVQIHADDTQARGSLTFDTDLGSLNAQLSLQLDRLAHALREPRGR